MSSNTVSSSPTITYVIPCTLSGSGQRSEHTVTDQDIWTPTHTTRLLRFDSECVVIPESEWFPSSLDVDPSEHSKDKGFKAVFGLGRMKMVNRQYSLPLWPGSGESGTEDDEAPSTPQKKGGRWSFRVPIPT